MANPQSNDAQDHSLQAKAGTWRIFLGINSSTLSLLGTILLVTAATELWSPLIPEYLQAIRRRSATGDTWGMLIVGFYGMYRDGLEALNYYAGGAIAGRFNTRRSLLFFNFLPLIGLALLAFWDSTLAVFVAVPFVFAWDSIAGPATITVVGESLPPDRRTMALSLQSISRRLSRIFAYCVSAPLIWWLGRQNGVRADAVIAFLFVLAAGAVQLRFQHIASKDSQMVMHKPGQLFKRFNSDLRRLLAADICARWAEGLAGPLIILYCVPILAADPSKGTSLYQSLLLNIQAITNILLYIFVGPLASRAGLAKKPYIGLTFIFFALFPLSLIAFGLTFGTIGLALAFIIGGLREIGEPARKAMIADLVPSEVRTQAIGLYWSMRSAAVMWASPIGAALWILGERIGPSRGPVLAFGAAGAIGLLGALLFFVKFGRKTELQSVNQL
ncbi:MAG: MFS transporter [Planctomycetes bacterium]|nr:MFS transporter [Planctomycetota bacterium]MBI3836090.1 MFS transporter [Planctomycetota bacterium]